MNIRTFFSGASFTGLVLLVCLALPGYAHAYIDPGAGSIIFQVVIAGLLGASFALKIYWRKIVSFFRNLFSKVTGGEGGDA